MLFRRPPDSICSMNESRVYKPAGPERMAIRERLRAALERHAEISFAYLHGSFVGGEGFRDIDVAVYLRANEAESRLRYELALEASLSKDSCGYPVDVRILNAAPLSFRYQVIKGGDLLFERDDDERADFQEATLSAYFDFEPYRALYLKETLGRGI